MEILIQLVDAYFKSRSCSKVGIVLRPIPLGPLKCLHSGVSLGVLNKFDCVLLFRNSGCRRHVDF